MNFLKVSFKKFKIDMTNVENLLGKLDKNNACGTDNVHSFVLKSCAPS